MTTGQGKKTGREKSIVSNPKCFNICTSTMFLYWGLGHAENDNAMLKR